VGGDERDELPQPRLAGDEQRGEQALAGEAGKVGAEHQPLAGEAVGPHAAGQHQDHKGGTVRAARTKPRSAEPVGIRLHEPNRAAAGDHVFGARACAHGRMDAAVCLCDDASLSQWSGQAREHHNG